MKKKIIGGFIVLSLLTAGVIPAVSAAQETTDSSIVAQLQAQIQSLLTQLQQLQDQIKALHTQQATLQEEIQALRLETRQLRIGSTGTSVSLLQELLASDPEIYPEGLITGYYGFLTEKAVRKFQQKFGIEQVGEVGPETRARINAIFAQGVGNSEKVPPGHFIAPGFLKNFGRLDLPEGQSLPPGIAKKFKNGGDDDDEDDEDDDDGDDDEDDDSNGDTTAPIVSSLSPADDATGVAVNTNLQLTFSEVVLAKAGSIILKNGGDNSTVEVISAASTTGTGTNVITVNPTADLATSTPYYVLVDQTAFEDGSGNKYAGISASSTWNFTTE